MVRWDTCSGPTVNTSRALLGTAVLVMSGLVMAAPLPNSGPRDGPLDPRSRTALLSKQAAEAEYRLCSLTRKYFPPERSRAV